MVRSLSLLAPSSASPRNSHPPLARHRGKPRNDQLDPYATYPIHQGRGQRPGTDRFSQGVQHTQSVARPPSLVLLVHGADP